ncbi:hypothetical protein JYT86_00380 [bacterium AH-315-N03]|nr:hypothetical protein [bacterium AH-315-N03]
MKQIRNSQFTTFYRSCLGFSLPEPVSKIVPPYQTCEAAHWDLHSKISDVSKCIIGTFVAVVLVPFMGGCFDSSPTMRDGGIPFDAPAECVADDHVRCNDDCSGACSGSYVCDSDVPICVLFGPPFEPPQYCEHFPESADEADWDPADVCADGTVCAGQPRSRGQVLGRCVEAAVCVDIRASGGDVSCTYMDRSPVVSGPPEDRGCPLSNDAAPFCAGPCRRDCPEVFDGVITIYSGCYGLSDARAYGVCVFDTFKLRVRTGTTAPLEGCESFYGVSCAVMVVPGAEHGVAVVRDACFRYRSEYSGVACFDAEWNGL